MYGNYDERGLRMPQYSGGNNNQGQRGYSSMGNMGNMGSNMTQDIGTTRTEQMMQADRNFNQQNNYRGGNQNFGTQSGYNSQPSYGNQFSNQLSSQSSNQFGSYNQNATNDIGTTQAERSMQGGMGGMSTMMQADHNYQQGSGTQYGYNNQPGYGAQFGNQFGGNQFSNQFGSYNQNATNDIGTTQAERSMQGGMGGMSTMMQADHNYQQGSGSQYGYSNQPNYGSQYGYSIQPNYGSQLSSHSSNQFGSYNQNATNDIGTTQAERTMQGSMGGMSSMMQADRNYQQNNYRGGQSFGGNQQGYGSQSGYSSQPSYGSQYGYSSQPNYGNQSSNQFSNQFGSYNQNATNDIGTTHAEQSMQGSMGGLSSMMQADRGTSSSGNQGYTSGMSSSQPSYTGTGYGYGSQYSSEYNSQLGNGSFGMSNNRGGTQNPGDTALEQSAKRNLGSSGMNITNTMNTGYQGEEF